MAVAYRNETLEGLNTLLQRFPLTQTFLRVYSWRENSNWGNGDHFREAWYWATGQHVTAASWGSGFPSGFGRTGALFNTKDGWRLANVRLSQKCGFVCEQKRSEYKIDIRTDIWLETCKNKRRVYDCRVCVTVGLA